MDDYETATYLIMYNHSKTVDRDWWFNFLGFAGEFYDPETCNVTFDWSNRLGQNRSRMATDWTGIRGLEMEDFAMATSIGHDFSRSKEHLVTSDIAIARTRRMVLNAIRDVEDGENPPAVDVADMSRVGAYDRNLTPDESWQAHAPFNRQPEPA